MGTLGDCPWPLFQPAWTRVPGLPYHATEIGPTASSAGLGTFRAMEEGGLLTWDRELPWIAAGDLHLLPSLMCTCLPLPGRGERRGGLPSWG